MEELWAWNYLTMDNNLQNIIHICQIVAPYYHHILYGFLNDETYFIVLQACLYFFSWQDFDILVDGLIMHWRFLHHIIYIHHYITILFEFCSIVGFFITIVKICVYFRCNTCLFGSHKITTHDVIYHVHRCLREWIWFLVKIMISHSIKYLNESIFISLEGGVVVTNMTTPFKTRYSSLLWWIQ